MNTAADNDNDNNNDMHLCSDVRT